MTDYGLPKEIEIQGKMHRIRTDFRCILDIFAAFADPELTQEERIYVCLDILYVDFESFTPDMIEEAIEKCMTFLNGGREDKGPRGPKLIDWEFDYPYIIAPVNRIMGKDVRGMKYLHWWTFLSAFHEIGECTLSQIVRIRSLKARGKLTDRADKEWYRQNRDIVDIPAHYPEAEEDLLKLWGGKK